MEKIKKTIKRIVNTETALQNSGSNDIKNHNNIGSELSYNIKILLSSNVHDIGFFDVYNGKINEDN